MVVVMMVMVVVVVVIIVEVVVGWWSLLACPPSYLQSPASSGVRPVVQPRPGRPHHQSPCGGTEQG